jgi:D-Tyr-tRNAtyr deacylase
MAFILLISQFSLMNLMEKGMKTLTPNFFSLSYFPAAQASCP